MAVTITIGGQGGMDTCPQCGCSLVSTQDDEAAEGENPMAGQKSPQDIAAQMYGQLSGGGGPGGDPAAALAGMGGGMPG